MIGKELIDMLRDAMNLPANCRRVIIDAEENDEVRIWTEEVVSEATAADAAIVLKSYRLVKTDDS